MMRYIDPEWETNRKLPEADGDDPWMMPLLLKVLRSPYWGWRAVNIRYTAKQVTDERRQLPQNAYCIEKWVVRFLYAGCSFNEVAPPPRFSARKKNDPKRTTCKLWAVFLLVIVRWRLRSFNATARWRHLQTATAQSRLVCQYTREQSIPKARLALLISAIAFHAVARTRLFFRWPNSMFPGSREAL
jgi:hypothetical protein